MAKKKEMDKLSMEVHQAIAAGMSYGKWKAMQGVPAKVVKTDGLPEGWKRCLWCNAPFKPKVNQRYCDYQCQKSAQYNRERERKQKEVVK